MNIQIYPVCMHVCMYIYIYIYNIYIYTHTHTAIQKFGISKIFMFLMESFMLIKIKNTEKTVILWNIIAISNIGFLL